MKKIFVVIISGLPFLALGQDPSITTCGPRVFQKGIGVGNNNYQGRNCNVPVQVETVTIVREREIASDNEATTVVPKEDIIAVPSASDNKELETGYDYYDDVKEDD